nr:hypothetical protein [Cellulomonas sp. PhB143]
MMRTPASDRQHVGRGDRRVDEDLRVRLRVGERVERACDPRQPDPPGHQRRCVELPVRQRVQRVAELQGRVADDEPQVELLVHREGRTDPVRAHADADDDDAGVQRGVLEHVVDHPRHPDALEDDGALRRGRANGVQPAPDGRPRHGQLREPVHGVEAGIDLVGHALDVPVPARGEGLPRRVDGGVEDDVGPAPPGEGAAARGVVGRDDRADAPGLEDGDHGEPDRPAAEDQRDVLLLHLPARDGVPRDRHRLGDGGGVRGEPVRHGQGERLLHDDLLGIAAGRVRRQADPVDLPPAPDHRDGDDGGAHRDRSGAPRADVRDGAVDLVAHDDGLLGAHVAVVAAVLEHLGELVRVPAGVQVRAADAAAVHVQQQLPGAGHRVRELDELELALRDGDRPHASAPVVSR